MKKVSYSMAAMNRKQCILCIIMTDRLRLIRYIELGENSVPIARSFESPITGKLLAYVWKVESSKWVEWLFWTLWRTVCYATIQMFKMEFPSPLSCNTGMALGPEAGCREEITSTLLSSPFLTK